MLYEIAYIDNENGDNEFYDEVLALLETGLTDKAMELISNAYDDFEEADEEHFERMCNNPYTDVYRHSNYTVIRDIVCDSISVFKERED